MKSCAWRSSCEVFQNQLQPSERCIQTTVNSSPQKAFRGEYPGSLGSPFTIVDYGIHPRDDITEDLLHGGSLERCSWKVEKRESDTLIEKSSPIAKKY